MGLGNEDHELMVIFVIVLIVAACCWFGYKGFTWDQPPRYDTGVSTDPKDSTFGSGYPVGTYVGDALGFNPGGY
jgi:hypothetical protein